MKTGSGKRVRERMKTRTAKYCEKTRSKWNSIPFLANLTHPWLHTCTSYPLCREWTRYDKKCFVCHHAKKKLIQNNARPFVRVCVSFKLCKNDYTRCNRNFNRNPMCRINAMYKNIPSIAGIRSTFTAFRFMLDDNRKSVATFVSSHQLDLFCIVNRFS